MEKLNTWIALIANVAVLVGIIFLVVEISQNTQALKASAIQASTSTARENISMLIENPSLIEIIRKDPSELTEAERLRGYWLSRHFWLSMQGLYQQWSLGVLPESEWLVWLQTICINTTSERGLSGRTDWLQNTDILAPEFVTYVGDNCADA